MTLHHAYAGMGLNTLKNEIVIKSANEEIRKAKEFVLEQLRHVSILEKDRSNIAFCVAEAVTNAIKHGNKSDSSKKVKIEIETDMNQVCVIVHDEGKGFDISSIPDPTEEDNLTNPSGRGVFFIKKLMTSVEVMKDSVGASVKMIRLIKND